MERKPVRSNVPTSSSCFFFHKRRNVLCIMTSSIIPFPSILNIWRRGGWGGGGVDSPASLRRIVEAGLCTSFIVYLWSKPADQWCVCCNRCIIARFALLITDNIKDLALKINDPQQNHSEIHCCWDKEDRLPMQKLSRSIQRVRLLNDHDRHS